MSAEQQEPAKAMTAEEKAAEYDKLVMHLWDHARYGNLLQSTIAAAYIRTFKIVGPEGEDPESA